MGIPPAMPVGCQGEILQVTKHVEVLTMGVACPGATAGMPDTLLLSAPAVPLAEGCELTRYHLALYPTFPCPDVGQPKRQHVSRCDVSPECGGPAHGAMP